MGITNIVTGISGEAGFNPNLARIKCTDDSSVILAPNYLASVLGQAYNFNDGDFALINSTVEDASGLYQVSLTNNQINLKLITLNNSESSVKNSCLCATTTALSAVYVNGPNNDGIGATLTFNSTGFQTVDGVVLRMDSVDGILRVLVKNGPTNVQGIYDLTADGTTIQTVLTRSSDFNQSDNVQEGDFTLIVSGNVNGGTIWYEDLVGPFDIGFTAITFSQVNGTAVPWTPNYVKGLNLSWVLSGPPALVSVAAGECIDSTNIHNMISNSPISLNISTNGAGGLDTGSYATDTWYAIYLIGKTTSSTVSAVFSTSFSAPNLSFDPTYTLYRYIGSVHSLTVGTSLYEFYQRGNYNDRTFYWTTTIPSVITDGTAISPTTFSCAEVVSPFSNEALGFNYNFNPGTSTDPFNALALYGAAADSFPILVVSPGLTSTTSDSITGTMPSLPLDNTRSAAYAIVSAAGSANLVLSVLGYKEYI